MIKDREVSPKWQRGTGGQQTDGNMTASPEISSETSSTHKTADISSEIEYH